MGDAELTPVTITISLTRDRRRSGITATTWGVIQGRYGSLGRVYIPAGRMPDVTDKDSLARLILTALYGLDYDL
jgi:hypothetical protein